VSVIRLPRCAGPGSSDSCRPVDQCRTGRRRRFSGVAVDFAADPTGPGINSVCRPGRSVPPISWNSVEWIGVQPGRAHPRPGPEHGERGTNSGGGRIPDGHIRDPGRRLRGVAHRGWCAGAVPHPGVARPRWSSTVTGADPASIACGSPQPGPGLRTGPHHVFGWSAGVVPGVHAARWSMGRENRCDILVWAQRCAAIPVAHRRNGVFMFLHVHRLIDGDAPAGSLSCARCCA
jgi:hypothetical protein